MRREVVVKKVMTDYGEYRSFIVVEIDHRAHTITFVHDGKYPMMESFMEMCLVDPDIRAEIMWGMEAKRKNDAYISHYIGYSGCQDITLHVNHGNSSLNRYLRGRIVAGLHVTMYGKTNPDGCWWAGDLAMILYHYQSFRFIGNTAEVQVVEWKRMEKTFKWRKMERTFKYIPLNDYVSSNSTIDDIRADYNSNGGDTYSAGSKYDFTDAPQDRRRRRN